MATSAAKPVCHSDPQWLQTLQESVELAGRTVAARPIPFSEGLDRRPALILHDGLFPAHRVSVALGHPSGASALIRSENFAILAPPLLTVVRLKLDFDDAKIMLVSWSMFRNYLAAKASVIAVGK